MAFEDEVAAHAPRLYRLAFLYLRDAAGAEDAVQETVLRYWRVRATVREVAPWLNRTLRNVCLNMLRRSAREDVVDPASLPEAPEGTGTGADSLVSTLSMTQTLLRLALPYREALIWRYYLGVPDAEAARQLDLTPSGWRARLHRARHALAALLREEVAGQ